MGQSDTDLVWQGLQLPGMQVQAALFAKVLLKTHNPACGQCWVVVRYEGHPRHGVGRVQEDTSCSTDIEQKDKR